MRHAYRAAALLLVLSTTPATAGTAALVRGAALPPLHGELLTGATLDLPAGLHSRVALLAFGFSRGSSKQVQAWTGRFHDAFGADSAYTCLGVPLFGGALARLARPMITAGMRKGTPEAERDRVLLVWEASDEWKERLQYVDGDTAYLVVVGRDGRVAWRGAGAPDAARWQEVVAALHAAR